MKNEKRALQFCSVTITLAAMDARSNSEYCKKQCCIGELLHYHVDAVLENYCMITWMLY